MGFLIWLSIASIVASSGIKAGAAARARDRTNKAIDQVYEAQSDRLQHAYDAQLTTIQETAQTVRGQQNQALVAMGHTGGVDSAAAAVIEGTSQEEAKDIDLLDQNLSDAIADLDAETNMARTRTENAYEGAMTQIVTDAIGNLTKVGLGFGNMALGLTTPATTTFNTILGGEGALTNGSYTETLLGLG